MNKILLGIYKTQNFIGKTVKEQNPNVMLDYMKVQGRTFGVKNTSEIGRDVIKKLLQSGYIWNTVDISSDRGRAIDISLLNPITSKSMTGSSSGTALNVLYGLNTVGIGTDGGGSVLAPAISLSLYSALLSGIGLKGKSRKQSTDEIYFTPGIGIITQNFLELENILKVFQNSNQLKESSLKNIVLSEEVEISLKIELQKKYNVVHIKKKELFYRNDLIEALKRIFSLGEVFIYIEKNIDVLSSGDSVLGMLGKEGEEIQKKSNKKFLKVFNMLDCTVITIPLQEVASALVIAAPRGEKGLQDVLELAKEINKEYRPQLFQEYFLNYPFKKIDNRLFDILEEI